MMRIVLRILCGLPSLAALVAAGGCAWLPASGPASLDVRTHQIDPHSIRYALVPVTARGVDVLARAVPRRATEFGDRRPPREIRFGVGDIINVTIFEAAAGGLFIPSEAGVRPGNFITIPPQPVDSNGNISIPYGGAIRAKGRTQVEV